MRKLLPILLATVVGLYSSLGSAQQRIKVATEAAYAPFEYINENNQITGFDIDIVKALCSQIDASCSFHNQAFDSLIPALKFRRFDLAVSSIDITKDRAKQVAFTDPYYQNSAVFVAKKEGGYPNIASLKGQRVGLQNGTTYQRYIIDKLPDLKPTAYANYQDAFIDLKSGRIKAIFGDKAALAEWFKDNKDLVYVDKPVKNQEYFGVGFGIAMNKKNIKLQEKLNQALKTIKDNGQYDVIYQRYFGNE